MDDDIAKHLGLAPLKDVVDAEIIETTSMPPAKVDTTDADRDYINVGHQALQDLLDVSTQSQHPRAYEVLATTMKTLIDANKELVELSRRKQEDEKPKEESKPGVTNNNLFVGTPAELQKMLKGIRNESD